MQIQAIDDATGIGVEFHVPDNHPLADEIAAYATTLSVAKGEIHPFIS